MVLLNRISDALEEIESKKGGLRKALLTLLLEWKYFEQHLDLSQTCFQECFVELKSREKHLCSIQESIHESSKELELIRESLNLKRKQVEDKESEILGYVEDLKLRENKFSVVQEEAVQQLHLREEKLNEKENLIRGIFAKVRYEQQTFEKRLKEIGLKEKKLKQQDNGLKLREKVDSALLFSEHKPKELGLNKTIKRERATMMEFNVGCSSSSRPYCSENPLKKPKAEKSSDFGMVSANMTVRQNQSIHERDIRSDTDDDKGVISLEVHCPRAEFHDFDKDKEEGNFDIDQIWACYDNLDGMPRLYAQVKKVFTPTFKLQMVWLEAVDWINHDLQVSCGRFRQGSSVDISNRYIFSHQVICKKEMQGYYLIYPMKGEIWAVYRNCLPFKYEIVEVLFDFVGDVGVKVHYLKRVSGFMSIFKRRNCGTESFVIPANELYTFSHKVPSFKLTQNIREYFELDPASLPNYQDNACYNNKVKVDYEEVDDVFTSK
ncbi:uncharacterized protein [Nicotiana tomentosiformis]|uniref:uncharacterized protein n=1 Tax=Nicotiana tomentosiformis TaxID=4098 RepID=UPI00051BF708